jgi:hypothetical protein
MPTSIDKQRKNHPLYKSWCHIKQRCGNPSDVAYENYGGRGITYSKDWESFQGFYDDMGSSWEAGLSIERIDNEGNYCKENCRWATRKDQNNNTRRNKYIAFNNITKTLSQWSEELNIKSSTIRMRLTKGWSVDEALTRKRG